MSGRSVEVPHVIVHENARAVDDDARAVGEHQRISIDDRVAVLVEYRVVGGLLAFVSAELSGKNVVGGTRSLDRDVPNESASIGFARQRFYRNVHEIRVA